MPAKFTDNFVAAFSCPPGKSFADVSDTVCKGLVLQARESGQKAYDLMLYTPDRASRYRYRIGDASIFRVYTNTPRSEKDRERSIRDRANELKARSLYVDLRAAKKKAKADKLKAKTLDEFLEGHYLQHSKARHPEVQAARIKGAFPELLNTKLMDINDWRLKKWKKAVIGKKKVSTVKRDMVALARALEMARAGGLISINPLSAAERRNTDAVDFPEVPDDTRVRYLNADEEKQLRQALFDRDMEKKAARKRMIEHRKARKQPPPNDIKGRYADYLTPLVLIALNTGMRRGELLALEWFHVNFDNRLISVAAETSKNLRTRHIPMTAECYEVLLDWRKQSSDKTRVFTNRGHRIKRINRAWDNALEKTQIENFRFHDCRHTFASNLVMRGVSLPKIRDLLGHSSISMTERYAHLSPGHLRQAISVLNDPDAIEAFHQAL